MIALKRIVIATDGSRASGAAIEEALALTRDAGAVVTLRSVSRAVVNHADRPVLVVKHG